VGSHSCTEGRNFLSLARITRETLSARAALHAGTGTEMARKARSFRLKSITSPLWGKSGHVRTQAGQAEVLRVEPGRFENTCSARLSSTGS
jgi:hypothetical protein